jgi:DnaJ-class molecular chaperone
MAERDAYKVLQVDPQADDVVIRAAYRALAALYHPDRDPSGQATRRMTELNAAFARLRTSEQRRAYDRTRAAAAPPSSADGSTNHGNGAARPATRAKDTLDFGRYAGWTISQLAREDPDYLRWLSRHSAGIRYRAAIEAALKAAGQRSADRPSGA